MAAGSAQHWAASSVYGQGERTLSSGTRQLPGEAPICPGHHRYPGPASDRRRCRPGGAGVADRGGYRSRRANAVLSAGPSRRGTEQRRGGGHVGRPAGHRGTRSQATGRLWQARNTVDLPADLPLNPSCGKSARWRPTITPWVFFAALWVCSAAGPGRIAKTQRPSSQTSRPARSRHSRRVPPGK